MPQNCCAPGRSDACTADLEYALRLDIQHGIWADCHPANAAQDLPN
jgi:hypothetical protein